MIDYKNAYAELNDLCKLIHNESFDKAFPIFRKKLLSLSDKCGIDAATFFINWMNYNSSNSITFCEK